MLTELNSGVFDDGPDGRSGSGAWRRTRRGDLAPRPRGRSTTWVWKTRTSSSRRDAARTCGTRLASTGRASARQVADGNYDPILQVGSFKGQRATAWGLSSETGFRLSRKPPGGPDWACEPTARPAIVRHRTPTLQSFNPLFPGASFAGPIGLFGPTNMIDFTPFVSVVPRRNLVAGLRASVVPGGRPRATASTTPLLQLLAPPTAGDRPVDWLVRRPLVVWQATRHLPVSGALIRLKAGQRFSIAPWCGREPGCTRSRPHTDSRGCARAGCAVRCASEGRDRSRSRDVDRRPKTAAVDPPTPRATPP